MISTFSHQAQKLWFSSSEKKLLSLSAIFSLAVLSLGEIVSIYFSVSPLLPIGVSITIFLSILAASNPLLMLLFLIPFRMMFDFSGEFFSVRITDAISLSLSQLIGLQVFGLAFVFFLFHPRSILSIRKLFPFALFLLWGVLSLAYSVDVSETVKDILRVFDIFSLTLIAYVSSVSFFDVRRLFLSMLVSSIIPIAFGIWQLITGHGFTSDFSSLNRIYGTFGHPNVFGLFLFLIIVISFLFYRFFSDRQWEKMFSIVVGVFSTILLLPTMARVAWIAALSFFFLLAILRFRKLLMPLMFVAVGMFLIPSVQSRILDAVTFSADSSVLWRINIWSDGINQTFGDERALLGSGLDTFPVVITRLHSGEFGSAEAHNDYVKFFVEGGIIGLSVYLVWMLWFTFRFLLLSKEKMLDRRYKELAFAMFLLMISILLASLSDELFKSTPIQWMIWISVGSVLGFFFREIRTGMKNNYSSISNQ